MPDNDNPYAAPKFNEDPEPDAPLARIWVEGRFLVVASGVELPSRCVFTNEPVNDPLLAQTLKWAPSFRPVISEQRIRLKLAVSIRKQRRQRLRRFIGGAAQVTAALLLYLISQDLGFFSGVLVFSGIVAAVQKPTFLQVSKCKHDRFWLRGCGPEFLASCLNEFGTATFQPETTTPKQQSPHASTGSSG